MLSQYGGSQEKTTFSRAGHPRPLACESDSEMNTDGVLNHLKPTQMAIPLYGIFLTVKVAEKQACSDVLRNTNEHILRSRP